MQHFKVNPGRPSGISLYVLSIPLYWLRTLLTASPSAFSFANGAISSLGESGLPCSLCVSLCTLRVLPWAFLTFLFIRRVRGTRNTRYGWIATPYPTRSFTLQDVLSFIARVTVGTSVARRPPHRSLRAVFPHKAPQYSSLRTRSMVSPSIRLFLASGCDNTLPSHGILSSYSSFSDSGDSAICKPYGLSVGKRH